VFARPFDAERLVFVGPETPVARQATFFSASDNGTLVFGAARIAVSRLTWFDRQGRRAGLVGEPKHYQQIVMSPRGRHATLVRRRAQEVGDDLSNPDLWDVDLASGVLSALTRDPAADADPSWSPDERRVAFTSGRKKPLGVFVKNVASGAEEPLAVNSDRPLMVDQ
jgi:hypothetical protein